MKILKITSSVVLVVLVISTIIKIYNNYNVDHAFVVKNNSVVKSGYSNDYSDLFTLKEGTSLKIKASKNGWYKIQTIEDQKGWINSASIELVDIYH